MTNTSFSKKFILFLLKYNKHLVYRHMFLQFFAFALFFFTFSTTESNLKTQLFLNYYNTQ